MNISLFFFCAIVPGRGLYRYFIIFVSTDTAYTDSIILSMKRNILLLSLLSIVLFSCARKDQATPAPTPDPSLRLDSLRIPSYNTFKIYGTINAPSWIKDASYGIVYSIDTPPNIQFGTVIPLGDVKDSLKFSYVAEGLQGGKSYYFRAFLKGSDKVWYSVELQSFTSQLKVEDIHNTKISRKALTGVTVNLTFSNSVPDADLEVFVGTYKVDISYTVNQSILFTIPASVPPGDYKITVKKGAYTAMSAKTIQVLEGSWQDLTAPPFTARSRTAYFVLNNKGYIVGGTSSPLNAEGTNEVWSYDLSSRTWTQKNNFPTNMLRDAIAFNVNNKVYLFGGITGYNSGTKLYSPYIWEYDPLNDQWINKGTPPDFKNTLRVQTTGVVYNNKIYFGTGSGTTDNIYRDWMAYDPALNKWTMLEAFLDVGRKACASFLVNDKIYLVGGDVFTVVLDDLWEYDIIANTWARVPGKPIYGDRTGTTAVTVGSTSYIYGGAYRSVGAGGYYYTNRNDCWKFDPVSKTWTEVARYTGTNAPLCQPAIFPTAKGFILYGGSSGDIWQSSPAFAEFITD